MNLHDLDGPKGPEGPPPPGHGFHLDTDPFFTPEMLRWWRNTWERSIRVMREMNLDLPQRIDGVFLDAGT